MQTAGIAEFLRARRERFGFSVRDIASLAGLSTQQVEQAESGGPTLSLAVVHALAGALAFDEAALLRGDVGSILDARRLPGWFRSHDAGDEEAFSPRDARLFARAVELSRIGAFLWEIVERKPAPIESLRAPVSIDPAREPWQQGYEIGAKTRVRCGPAGPIENVQVFLGNLGIHVALVQFDSMMRQAVSIYCPGEMPIVLLNQNHARVRNVLARRVVLTHELGHLCSDGGERDLSLGMGMASGHRRGIEQRANGFAPAFLAPPEWVKADFEREGIPAEELRARARRLALQWGFTAEGAAWHLKNCQDLPLAQAEDLRRDGQLTMSMAPAYERFELSHPLVPEPADDIEEVAALTDGLIRQLVARAHARAEITASRAREILRMG